MLVEEKLVALSNTNVTSERKVDGGKKLVKFATTPVMSSYLVGFAIGDFEYIETTYRDNIPIRVYTTSGKSKDSYYALELAKQGMYLMEEWFDYKCPLSKIDLIALPDFAMGAMENWGLVTFREACLIVDDQTALVVKARSSLTITHELVHFWFGNLVIKR